jgi:hypothetical protein
MRITGTLHSIGHHSVLTDESLDDRPSRFTGILITADEATLRAASNLLCATVDIYPHPVNELIKGECTPDNYAHAMARLAHAEAATPMADHLAREVRSSQALIAMNHELIDRVIGLEQAAKARADSEASTTETPLALETLAEINSSLQEMIDARDESHHEIGQYLLATHKAGEVDADAIAILDGHHIGDREVDDGERGETTLEAALRLLKLAKQRGAFVNTDEREAAWEKYLDLRKQARRLADDHKAQEPLLAEAFGIAKRYDFDIDRMELADAKKSIATLEAQHTALLAKQAEQERLLSIYRTKYHEADRALQQAHVEIAANAFAVDLLAQCTPPGMFIREDDKGWRLTTDDDTWWYKTEKEAHAVAWDSYRDKQADARAVKDDDASAGD